MSRLTVAGLSAVNVQVEPLNADAERDGLTRAALLADVESTLRASGIRVLEQTELFLEPSVPILHLDVMTALLDGRYAYSVRIELWQAVGLVRDPGVRALALTWSRPQVVGSVAAERLGDIRSEVRAALDAFVADTLVAPDISPSGPDRPLSCRDCNLLVSSSWGGQAATRREIRDVLRLLGDDRPSIVRTVAKGLLGVRTNRDARHVVRELRRIAEQEPQRCRFTSKWVPVDTWSSADLDALEHVVTGLRDRIRAEDTWRLTVEKHRHVRLHERDVIAALARLIDAKVDLTNPDKILRVDLVGDDAAVSVVTPDEIFSSMKPPRRAL